jgi:hypothetical protein
MHRTRWVGLAGPVDCVLAGPSSDGDRRRSAARLVLEQGSRASGRGGRDRSTATRWPVERRRLETVGGKAGPRARLASMGRGAGTGPLQPAGPCNPLARRATEIGASSEARKHGSRSRDRSTVKRLARRARLARCLATANECERRRDCQGACAPSARTASGAASRHRVTRASGLRVGVRRFAFGAKSSGHRIDSGMAAVAIQRGADGAYFGSDVWRTRRASPVPHRRCLERAW